LELCSPAFCELFDTTELVIAKGQANIETLHRCDRDVFFLTQVKCPVIARSLGAEVGDWLVEFWQPGQLTIEETEAVVAEVQQ
jgi:uncharacterized protein with ATP-grasp and redox domains